MDWAQETTLAIQAVRERQTASELSHSTVIASCEACDAWWYGANPDGFAALLWSHWYAAHHRFFDNA